MPVGRCHCPPLTNTVQVCVGQLQNFHRGWDLQQTGLKERPGACLKPSFTKQVHHFYLYCIWSYPLGKGCDHGGANVPINNPATCQANPCQHLKFAHDWVKARRSRTSRLTSQETVTTWTSWWVIRSVILGRVGQAVPRRVLSQVACSLAQPEVYEWFTSEAWELVMSWVREEFKAVCGQNRSLGSSAAQAKPVGEEGRGIKQRTWT